MESGEQKSRVNRQREAQYGPSFQAESLSQRADDLRRALILKYSLTPEQRAAGERPRDMWREIASRIIDLVGAGEETIGLDAGTSSGYFIRQLLESGLRGSLVGVDMVANHFPLLRQELERDYPGARVELGEADAETLDRIKIFGDLGASQERPILDDVFDFSVSLNTYHHTDNPEEIIKSLWRVTKPGGYVATMARAVGHFNNIYEKIGPQVAKEYNTTIPEPFYDKYDFMRLDKFVDDFDGFESVDEGLQAGWLYIDGDDEGWNDLARVVFSLLPEFEKIDSGALLTAEELRDFLEQKVKTRYFRKNKIYYQGLGYQYPQGFVTDFVFQKYRIMKVIK